MKNSFPVQFTRIPSAVITDQNLDSEEKLILTALFYFYPKIFPSHDKIASLAGMIASTIKRKLKSLKTKEYLTWLPGGEGKSNFYEINMLKFKFMPMVVNKKFLINWELCLALQNAGFETGSVGHWTYWTHGDPHTNENTRLVNALAWANYPGSVEDAFAFSICALPFQEEFMRLFNEGFVENQLLYFQHILGKKIKRDDLAFVNWASLGIGVEWSGFETSCDSSSTEAFVHYFAEKVGMSPDPFLAAEHTTRTLHSCA